MKVKAKWAVKVNGVWRKAGEVFEVDSTAGLMGAVEVLKAEAKPAKVKAETDSPEAGEPEPEAKAEPKPKTAARTRRKSNDK